MEINRACRLGEITVSIPITIGITHGNKIEINRTYRLGEIVNPAPISTYFTELARRGGYFYCISSCLFHGAKRSLFPLYFHPISPARRRGYFCLLQTGSYIKSTILTCVLIKLELALATILPDCFRISASQWFRLAPERTSLALTSSRSPTCAADKKSTDKLMLVIRNSDPATKLPIPITSSSINEAMPPCKMRPGLHWSGRTV